ncbi:glycosyltransferase [Sphingobacterium hungaricum]|uniref:Glycosyltransferase n=1 Tax=Sphingobacterium hungaricum TaxID=2082723 RepID=A0A928UXR6_9SPHI|nr:glycosyltransferase [Sphingobacterium hungaricum]MBE8713049.1 glycosyltransferase [Sphingobacterium hungaricum]
MQKLLIIGLVWPEPTSSAAGWRMMQLIALFLEQNFEVHFASAAGKSAFSADLKTLGIQEHEINLNDSSFDEFVKNLNPLLVLFDRFMIEEQFGWRVRENCPNALTFLDTEDLHFLRKARELAYKKNKEIDLYTVEAKREIAAILRCDISLIISKEEFTLLTEQFHIPAGLLHYLPFLEDEVTEEEIQHWKSFEERKDFIFIGNFLHEPNWQTVLTLKKGIWPTIQKQLPDAELHIYGAYASQKVYDLQNKKEKFIVKDRAINARMAMQNYRVLLAPITFGAGVKGKFIDAMKSGTPSVTTTIGAESMSQNLNWNGTIQDDFSLFIQDAINLYADENFWQTAQNNGIEIIKKNYSSTIFKPDFFERIQYLLDNIQAHRKQHFISEIMNFHFAQSSKYMSLWIEEKNKKI